MSRERKTGYVKLDRSRNFQSLDSGSLYGRLIRNNFLLGFAHDWLSARNRIAQY